MVAVIAAGLAARSGDHGSATTTASLLLGTALRLGSPGALDAVRSPPTWTSLPRLDSLAFAVDAAARELEARGNETETAKGDGDARDATSSFYVRAASALLDCRWWPHRCRRGAVAVAAGHLRAAGDGPGAAAVEIDGALEVERWERVARRCFVRPRGAVAADAQAARWAAELRTSPDFKGPLPGQQKGAKFSTLKAHISASFHSFQLIFGRVIISPRVLVR